MVHVGRKEALVEPVVSPHCDRDQKPAEQAGPAQLGPASALPGDVVLPAGVDATGAVLIGDPGRAFLPKTGLQELAEYRVPTTREIEDTEIKRTRVFKLLPG